MKNETESTKKRGETSEKSTPKAPQKEMKKPESEKVSLQVWMRVRLAKDKRLRPEHIAALGAHMKSEGLGPMEIASDYEKAYKKY